MASMAGGYETLEHTADTGFLTWGASLSELFENAARALVEMTMDLGEVRTGKEVTVELTAGDTGSLLVKWLNEVLYLFDAGELAPARFQVDEVVEGRLRGRIAGEVREPERHRWTIIVKAATYYETEVAHRNGRWEARVYLDV